MSRRLLRALAGASAVALYAGAAFAGSPIGGAPVGSPLSPTSSHGAGVTNNCAGKPLDVNFSTGLYCAAATQYTTLGAIPGISDSPSVLSGLGSTFKFAVNGNLLQAYAPGQERLNASGITIEPIEIDLLPWNNDFSQAQWGCYHASIANDQGPAPDGSNTAALFTITNSASDGACSNNNSPVAQAASTTYSDGIWIAPGTNGGVAFRAYDNTNVAQINCNASTGSCTSPLQSGYTAISYTFNQLGTSNWWHACLTYTTPATTGLSTRDGIFPGPTGSETSGNAYVWGLTHEASATCNQTLPTRAAAVTRAADVLSLPFTFPGSTPPVCDVIFGARKYNALIPNCTSPINLAASGAAWAGYPVNEVVVSATEPEPAPAAAAGFNTLTFDVEAFNTTTVDDANTFGPGFKLYHENWFGYSPTPASETFNTDGTVTIASTATGGGALTSAAEVNAAPYFRGVLFGGGYYVEITMLIPNPNAVNNAGLGWPSWYLFSGSHIQADGAGNPGTSYDWWVGQAGSCAHGFEDDLGEYFNALYGNNPAAFAMTGHDWAWGTCAANTTSQQFYFPAGGQASFQSYHTYGQLWVPATDTSAGYYQNYYDGAPWGSKVTWTEYTVTKASAAAFTPASANLTMSAGNPGQVAAGWKVYDVNTKVVCGVVSSWIGTTLALNTNACTSQGASDVLKLVPPPPAAGQSWLNGVLDQDHMALVFSGSAQAPMKVLRAKVWQASTAGNLYN